MLRWDQFPGHRQEDGDRENKETQNSEMRRASWVICWNTPTSEEALSVEGTNLRPHKHTMTTDTLNVSLTVTGDEHPLPKHPLLCVQVFCLHMYVSVGLPYLKILNTFPTTPAFY